jgi:hypothetical protein
MKTVKFQIWVRTRTDVFIAFGWCYDAESGIARARREAPGFGFDVVDVWAVEA